MTGWARHRLGEVLSLEYGHSLPARKRDPTGIIPVAGSNGPDGNHSRAIVSSPGIVVGRKGTVGRVHWYGKDFWPIDTTYYVVPKFHLDLRWAYYMLSNLRLWRLATATGVPGLNREDAYKLEVSVPPIAEQQRIVEILDQADKLRRLRAASNTTSERILPALFLKIFGDPTTNPMGWKTRFFGDILLEPLRNGVSPSSSGYFRSTVLTLSAITGVTFDEHAVKIGHFEGQPTMDKEVDNRDLLICRGNGNLSLMGRARFPIRTLAGTVFPDTVIAARVNPNQVERAYLEALWNTRWMRSQVESRATTTSGIHKINQAALEGLAIRLPPISIQARFARLSDAIYRNTLARTSEALDRLFALLFHRAFSEHPSNGCRGIC